MKKKSVGKRILKALKQFADDIESGKPIKATRVQRVETPDGPMHLTKKVILKRQSHDR